MGERFDMTKKDKINSWSINDSLMKYALSQMNYFIPDRDIKKPKIPYTGEPELQNRI